MRPRPRWLRERLADVEARIDELAGLRRRLRDVLRKAEKAPDGVHCRCRIIEGS